MNTQRVWIELERPVVNPKGPRTNSEKDNPDNVVKTVEEQTELMKKRAKLASNMIRRLGVEQDEQRDRITIYMDDGIPMYAHDMGMVGFSVMNDNGIWLNLDYLGRE